jgi:hypothetical protein
MALIAVAALAALKVATGFHQGEMIRESNRLRRKIDSMNIEAAEIDAWEAERFGYSQIARYESVIDSTVADQKLTYAAQGVDVSYGTAAEVQADTRVTGMLNKLEIERQARERANGFRREARNMKLGSSMSALQASLDAASAESAGIMGGLDTMVSGYSKSGGGGTTPQTKAFGYDGFQEAGLSQEYRKGNLRADSDLWMTA